MKRALGFLSVVALTFVLTAPLPAQTLKLSASVPFEFTVAGRSMPAGDYRIEAGSSPMGAVRVSTGNEGVYFLAISETASQKERTGESLLIFHRYGDRYFLSSIVDGSLNTGVEIPTSGIEKELSNTASLQKFETVAVLARR
jgi:hypothetical protein